MRAAAVGLLVALSVVAAACSPAVEPEESGQPEESTTSSATSTTESEADPDPSEGQSGPDDDDLQGEGGDGALTPEAVQELLAELDGQLAIGNGPLVAVARPDGRRYVELDGGQTNLASQPTWSVAGDQLVWSSVSALAQQARVQTFDEEGVADGEPLVTSIPGQPVFYFQWRTDGDEILYLRNSGRRSSVEAGVLTPGGPARWLSDGNPFFVAWAPTEPIVAAHVGEERVALFDPAGAAPFGVPVDEGDETDEGDEGTATVPEPDDEVVGRDLADGGGFSSPAWLDDRTVLAVVAAELSAIDIVTGEVDPLIDVGGPIRFVLSPDRSKVAFQVAVDLAAEDDVLEVGWTPAQNRDPDPALVVVDIEDGDVEVVTERPVVAWEWSPDSSKLAWLEIDGAIAQRRGRWRFWSADGPVVGDTRSPTLQLSIKEVVNYLPFFAQYSFSLQRWSPDSSAFALVGSVNGRNGVWIHLVDVPAAPTLVAPGDVVSWGFGPTPSPDAGLSPA